MFLKQEKLSLKSETAFLCRHSYNRSNIYVYAQFLKICICGCLFVSPRRHIRRHEMLKARLPLTSSSLNENDLAEKLNDNDIG